MKIIELTVRNHPGVMSHITGLFARRAFNLEGIFVSGIGDKRMSRILLQLGDECRLDQIIKQLEKLHDVDSVNLLEDDGIFARLEAVVG